MNLELVHKVYKDSDMAVSTIDTLLKEMKHYDIDIVDTIRNIKKGYERYKKKSSELLKSEKIGLDKVGIVSKMMADTGVKQKLKYRHSESGVVSMLIKGMHMGVKDIDKILEQLEEKADQESITLARDFLVFQKDNIQALKKYL